jgi:hypothetical protein
MAKARLRPRIWPSLPPVIMSHHQRVEGDRGLDPGHRRAEVLSNRRNRHVHDRTVQRHQELRRGKRQQDTPGRRSRALTAAAHLGLSTYIHTASSITVTDNQAQIVPVCPRVTVTVCS